MDRECATLAERYCALQPRRCQKYQDLFASAELPGPACRDGLERWAAVEASAPELKLPAATLILKSLLSASPKLTPDQVDELFSEARDVAGSSVPLRVNGAIEGARMGPPVTTADEQLPSARGAVAYHPESPAVRVTSDGVSFGDGEAGSVAAQRSALAFLARKDAERRLQRFGYDPLLQVHADATVSMDTVLDLLAVARKVGFNTAGLVVRNSDELRLILLEIREADADEGPIVELVLTPTGNVFDGRPVGDAAALTATLAARANKGHGGVIVRTSGAVPLRDVVDALEALRGPCVLDEAVAHNTSVSDACWYWNPRLASTRATDNP